MFIDYVFLFFTRFFLSFNMNHSQNLPSCLQEYSKCQKELRFAFNNPFLVKIRGGERVICVKKRIRDYLVSC